MTYLHNWTACWTFQCVVSHNWPKDQSADKEGGSKQKLRSKHTHRGWCLLEKLHYHTGKSTGCRVSCSKCNHLLQDAT